MTQWDRITCSNNLNKFSVELCDRIGACIYEKHSATHTNTSKQHSIRCAIPVWERVEQERVGLLNYYAWRAIGESRPAWIFIYLLYTSHELKWVEVISNVKSSHHANATQTHPVTVNCLFTKQSLVDNKICQIQNWVLFRWVTVTWDWQRFIHLFAFFRSLPFCFCQTFTTSWFIDCVCA